MRNSLIHKNYCYSHLYNGDFFEWVSSSYKNSVDLILADPPFGVEWFLDFPFDKLLNFYDEVLSLAGTAIVDCRQPYASFLVAQRPDWYKYSYIWEKNRLSLRHFVKARPLEDYLEFFVFSKGEFHPTAKNQAKYRPQRPLCVPPGFVTGECARTTLYHPVATDRIHPGQKPLELLKWLIMSHTDPGDTVLDHVMGSGASGVAANELSRNFVGIEIDEDIFNSAVNWIKTGTMKESTSGPLF